MWGCGREGDSPLVPSIPQLSMCRRECYMIPGVGAVKFKASPALVTGMREGFTFPYVRLMGGSSVPFEPSSPSDFLMLSCTIAHTPSTLAEVWTCCVDC